MVCFYLYGHIKIYIYNSFYGLFLSLWTYKDIYIYIYLILSMVCFYLYGHIKIYIYIILSMVCFYLYGHIKIYIYNSFYGLLLSLWIYKDIYI